MAFKAIAIVAISCLAVIAAQNPAEISQSCIGCICEAASGCDLQTGCDGDICGPFKITWAFWSDGGMPGKQGENDAQAFQRCASDAYCSAEAVKGYMQKFAKDCNGDGVIDCEDYARIHRLGGYGCRNDMWDTKYVTRFQTCRKAFPN